MKMPTNTIKKSDLRKYYPHRKADSHKGNNGRVMIVGGSKEYYGAPLLCALGALYSGCDLVYLFVPSCNFDVTRSLYPDFIVRQFEGDYLKEEHVSEILDFAKKCDTLLIGPGIGEKEESLEAVKKIVSASPIPLVLDAAAILAVSKAHFTFPNLPVVITPHRHEFEIFSNKYLDPTLKQEDAAVVRSIAMDRKIHIVIKGPLDTIVAPNGQTSFNETGNAGMTVGGSGDILSGIIASFISQKLDPHYACELATFALGTTGDNLFRQKGYFFSATDLALELPFSLRNILL